MIHRFVPTLLLTCCLVTSGLGGQELRVQESGFRKAESLTVYQQGFALVRDELSLTLSAGQQDLHFSGFPRTMRPETVAIRAEGFGLLEQSFDAMPSTSQALLEEQIGQLVYLDSWNPYQDRTNRATARLLAVDGKPIYLIGDEVHLDHPGRPVLPNWVERSPTLTWLVDAHGGDARAQLTYLVNRVDWQAHYVLNLEDDEHSGSLQGWAALSNASGSDYDQVELTLVAGDVAQANQAQAKTFMLRSAEAADFAPVESSVGEYYSYHFDRRLDLKDAARKQLPLLSPELVGVKKELRIRSQNGFLGRQFQDAQAISAQLHYLFESQQALPAGIVRVYLQGQMMGEDRIPHTGKGLDLDLNVGRSFDVRAERRQRDYHRVTSKRHRSEWEIRVDNAKDSSTAVIIDEMLSGDWRIVSSSLPYEKLNASTIRFRVDLGHRSTVVINYTVEVDY